jgi:hypothetical protein
MSGTAHRWFADGKQKNVITKTPRTPGKAKEEKVLLVTWCLGDGG